MSPLEPLIRHMHTDRPAVPIGRGAHETSSCSSASPRSLGAERVHCRLDVGGLRHVEITEDAVSIRAVLVDYEARCVAVAVHHVAVVVDGARPLLDDDTLAAAVRRFELV